MTFDGEEHESRSRRIADGALFTTASRQVRTLRPRCWASLAPSLSAPISGWRPLPQVRLICEHLERLLPHQYEVTEAKAYFR